MFCEARFTQYKEPILCEECIEYICVHKYPLLNYTDDTCAVCIDPFTKDTICYLSKCGHKFHKDCVIKVPIYKQVLEYEKIMENRRLEIQFIENEPSIDENEKKQLIKITKELYATYVEQDREDNCDIECPYCRQMSKKIVSYEELYGHYCNTCIPKIGSVSFRKYIELYEKYIHAIIPTPEMKQYYKEVYELFKEVINREKIQKIEEANLLTMRRRLFKK